jgi:hypothetical protein
MIDRDVAHLLPSHPHASRNPEGNVSNGPNRAVGPHSSAYKQENNARSDIPVYGHSAITVFTSHPSPQPLRSYETDDLRVAVDDQKTAARTADKRKRVERGTMGPI